MAWITHCISTVCFSITIYIASSEFFDSSHGLRKGDPLFPLLFVTVMEGLNKMMSATLDRDQIFLWGPRTTMSSFCVTSNSRTTH